MVHLGELGGSKRRVSSVSEVQKDGAKMEVERR